MPKRSLLLVLLASCTSCAGTPPERAPSSPPPRASSSEAAAPRTSPPASTRAKAVQLDADTPTKTAAGATFEAPKGWFLSKDGDMLLLEAPEHDVTLAFVEVAEKDAEKAIAIAWRRAHEGFARKPKTTTKPPARDGWDEITQIRYDIAAAESHESIALAQRKGDTTYVALIDGSDAGLDRRGAQLNTAVGSFRAAGVEDESFAGKKANTLDAKRLEAFAAFVEESRVKAKVPGVGVAIVQGHKIVFEKGFGTRSAAGKEPVGPNTLFMIGSITKSLTSLMMAKLVDEGRFTWDTPVAVVAPGFALGDAEATKKLAMRHTVCACTGLPRQDMTFFFNASKTTPESRVDEMKTLKPTTAFGETFQYSNLMVSAGGYIAARTADPKKSYGAAYDDAMRTRVLEPIGMKSSTFDMALAASRDHASPHALGTAIDVKALPVSAESWIPSIRPAGGMWSSAHDMARWVAVELDGGKTLEGKSVVSNANLVERRKPMARAAEKMSYGLAVMVEKYNGVDIVWHNGGTLGFNTLAMWLPQYDVGLVFLTNLAGAGSLLNASRRRFLELLFDGKDEAKQNLEFALTRRETSYAAEYAKLDRAPDKEWTTKLAGEYRSPILGRVVVRWENGHAVLDAGDWKTSFGRIQEGGDDKLVMLEQPWVGFDFLAKGTGDATTLTLDAGQEKYTFTRVAK
jgi:CubicO group peptidase (beta-lactamase class C family)